MKVLHIIARMNVGGTATYLFNLLSGLEKENVQTLLVFGEVSSNEKEDSRVKQLNSTRLETLARAISLKEDIRSIKEIKKIIEVFKPDLIHTHTFKAGLLLRVMRTDIPLVHTFHGHHLYDPDYGFLKRSALNLIERFLARRNRVIISIGHRVGEELISAGIGKRDQFRSIPPGVKPPKKRDRATIVRRLGLPGDRLNVLWMGRLTQVKRPDRVIEAAKHFMDVNFLIAGDGELRKSLESSKPNNVNFLGNQDSNDMWSIADIALLTSDSEGMPLTLIEAQVAGIPCVATDVGSVSEIVVDRLTGYVTSTKIDEIREALASVIKDSTLRSMMAKNAQERAESEFSIHRMVLSHIDVYNSVLKSVR